MRTKALIMFTASALVGLGAGVLAIQQSQGAFDPANINPCLRLNGMGGNKLRCGYQSGDVYTNALARTITIMWTADALENQAPDYSLAWNISARSLGSAQVVSDSQTFTTVYYPTACGKLSNGELLLGGVKPNGCTVIQRWVFVWPTAMPTPVVDSSTGLSHVDIVFPTVQKTTLYTSPSFLTTPRYVSGLGGILSSGSSQSALVQFSDPNDIMVLDMNSGSLTLLASKTNSTGLLGIAQSLSEQDYGGITVRNNTTGGYYYRFWRGSTDIVSEPPSVPILILVDSNRDGTIDSVLELSQDEYISLGLQDLNNYVMPWLD